MNNKRKINIYLQFKNDEKLIYNKQINYYIDTKYCEQKQKKLYFKYQNIEKNIKYI